MQMYSTVHTVEKNAGCGAAEGSKKTDEQNEVCTVALNAVEKNEGCGHHVGVGGWKWREDSMVLPGLATVHEMHTHTHTSMCVHAHVHVQAAPA